MTKKDFSSLTLEFALACLVLGASVAEVLEALWRNQLNKLIIALGFAILALWMANRLENTIVEKYTNRR